MSKMYVVTDNGVYLGRLLITDEKGHWWEYNINEDHRYYGIQDENDERIPYMEYPDDYGFPCPVFTANDFQVDLDNWETWDTAGEFEREYESDDEYVNDTAFAIENVISLAKTWDMDGHGIYDNKIPFTSKSLITGYYKYLDEFKGDWLYNCFDTDTILFNYLLDGNFSKLGNETLHKVLESLPDNVDCRNNYIPLHYRPELYNMTIDDMIYKYIETYEEVDET